MKKLLCLNVFAFFYALVFTIQAELLGNAYRLERITGWANGTVIGIAMLLLFLVSVVLLFVFTFKYLAPDKLKYLLTVLWLPYAYLLIWIFAELFPMTNPQDDPGGAVGLVLIGLFAAHFVYILFVNFVTNVICLEK